MRIAREEIFGPVLAIIPFDDEEAAVEIANDTPYGLAAYVQTGSPERAARLSRSLRAGAVHINGGAYEYGSPFGGYKASETVGKAGKWVSKTPRNQNGARIGVSSAASLILAGLPILICDASCHGAVTRNREFCAHLSVIAGNVAHADAAFEPWRIGDAGHAAGEVRSGYGNRVGFPRIANRIALHHQPDHFCGQPASAMRSSASRPNSRRLYPS